MTLQPGTALKPPVALKKPAAHGGVLAFTVTGAGRYRVALGAGLWVDVVANGAAVASAAHGHGPDCGAVKKFVDWTLAPGRYLLQLSGEPAIVQVEVVKVG